jgi:adenine deaminase
MLGCCANQAGKRNAITASGGTPAIRDRSSAAQLFMLRSTSLGGSNRNGIVMSSHSCPAVAYGLDRDEAMKAITLYPAQIIGVADRVGSLEVGKLASFFVTDGDPLDIRTNVEHVFIQGREIPLTNRQTALTKKYEQRYRDKAAAK